MKIAYLFCAFALFCTSVKAQTDFKTRNIFVITTDGFRWQEVFKGADSAIISDPAYVMDTALCRQLFWDADPLQRRRKLMPFFWNVIAEQGQLYGNRLSNNRMNVKNLYKISYPGYNEILTGYTDPGIILNLPRNNSNTNILEYFNNMSALHGKVVAFSSWNVFPYILNVDRSRLPVNSGYNNWFADDNDSAYQLIGDVQESVVHKGHCRYDWLTYLSAREYIQEHQPRIVFIGLGQTDEYAHSGRYDLYLQQAAAVDKMISDLWYYVQTNPFYKDRTTFIITTDHGRGSSSGTWSRHSLFTKGSAETWLAMIGPDIRPEGEYKVAGQAYAKQIPATMTLLMQGEPSSKRMGNKPLPVSGSAIPVSDAKNLTAK